MILRAAWVVLVTSPPIRDGFVEFVDDRITAVGAWRTADKGRRGSRKKISESRRAAPDVLDLGAAILTPGLVNPHTHLELTCYAGLIRPAPFWQWIGKLIPLRFAAGQLERETQAVIDGAWRSLRAGVTCVGDISRRNLAWLALKSLPIRKVCYVELLTLADHAPRNADELRVAFSEVQEDALLTAGITPHAPYSVPCTQIRAAVQLAHEKRRPWCTHWAETPEEVSFLQGGAGLPPFIAQLASTHGISSPGTTPGAYLDSCVGDRRPGLLAHCNYVSDSDIEHLAVGGHVVVYCPRAHRFFGHPPHPFQTMTQRGVTVAIGTDSLASNESLSILDELRFVATQVAGAPSSEALLRMATIDAAAGLGLDSDVGSLEVGKQADLAAFPCSPDTEDAASALVRTAPAPIGVWVAGIRVI